MAENVIREGRVERRIAKRQLLRGVAMLKACLSRHVSSGRKVARRMDTRAIRVEAQDATTHYSRNLQSISPRAAADFECERTGCETQHRRYLSGLFGCHPTRLPEIFPVSLDANIPIDLSIIIAVSIIVEVHVC